MKWSEEFSSDEDEVKIIGRGQDLFIINEMALDMSGQTLSEKIFSKASGKEARAGEFVMAKVDKAMIHDITGPLAVKGFYEIAGR